ncbi:hypothetical protein AB6A23_22980 [Paenibacillus tarimensis]
MKLAKCELEVGPKKKLLNKKVDGQQVDVKFCSGCKQWKPVDKFHVDKKGVGGRKSKCIRCRAAKNRLSIG